MDSAFKDLGLELAADVVGAAFVGAVADGMGPGAGPTHPGAEAVADLDRLQAERAERQVLGFQARIDRLTLINMAVWSLLKDKTGLTEKDLMDRVRQIDLLDGKEDGKLRKQVSKCPKCGRTMSPRHSRCMYCGADGLVITAFDAVL